MDRNTKYQCMIFLAFDRESNGRVCGSVYSIPAIAQLVERKTLDVKQL